MSKALLRYCDCSSYGYRIGHRPGCALHARLLIKERVCDLLSVGHFVPDEIEDLIDRFVEGGMPVGSVESALRKSGHLEGAMS